MKAREALTRKVGRERVALRDLIKEPPTRADLARLAKLAGGPENLVAPKRRKEAEGLAGDALVAWLAADGGRIRRPIIVTPKGITLGFAADAQQKLAQIL